MLFSVFVFSQEKSYKEKLIELERNEKTEIEEVYKSYPGNSSAYVANIQAKYNELRAKLDREEHLYNKNQQVYNNNFNKQKIYNQSLLENLYKQQTQSQYNYEDQLNSTINNLYSSVQTMVYNQVKTELNRRISVAKNFSRYENDKLQNTLKLYNSIPVENFSKEVNGVFEGYLINSERYSFVNLQKLSTVTPILVEIKNNNVENVFLYGKRKMQLNLSNLSNNKLTSGSLQLNNYNSSEESTVLVLEPFVTDNPKKYNITEEGVSYITVWSSNKKDEGKVIYIQELDVNGNIIREISTNIQFAKNEKELNSSLKKIPINSNSKLLFFGEISPTPYGNFPLYPKTPKNNFNALNDNEHRFVEIKKYRD